MGILCLEGLEPPPTLSDFIFGQVGEEPLSSRFIATLSNQHFLGRRLWEVYPRCTRIVKTHYTLLSDRIMTVTITITVKPPDTVRFKEIQNRTISGTSLKMINNACLFFHLLVTFQIKEKPFLPQFY